MEYNPRQSTTNLLEYTCHIYAKIRIKCYIGDPKEMCNLTLGNLVFEKNLKNRRLTMFPALPLVGKPFWKMSVQRTHSTIAFQKVDTSAQLVT